MFVISDQHPALLGLRKRLLLRSTRCDRERPWIMLVGHGCGRVLSQRVGRVHCVCERWESSPVPVIDAFEVATNLCINKTARIYSYVIWQVLTNSILVPGETRNARENANAAGATQEMNFGGNFEHDDDVNDGLVSRASGASAREPMSRQPTSRAAGAEAGGSTGGGASGVWAFLIVAGVVLGIVGVILGSIGQKHDSDLEHALKHDVAPVLELVYNETSAMVNSSRTYCSGSFLNLAYGEPPTDYVTPFRKRGIDDSLTSAVDPSRISFETSLKDMIRQREGEIHDKAAHKEAVRGVPYVVTPLNGTNGVLSIVRVGESVHIHFTTRAISSNSSIPIPIWEDPARVVTFTSLIPYECIPPVASWPNCNDTIPGVATCGDVLTDGILTVFDGTEAAIPFNVQHHRIFNFIGSFDGNRLDISYGFPANGYDESENYLVGVQSFITSTIVDMMNDAVMFDVATGHFHYKTDAPIDWAVPDSCLGACA